MTRPTGAVARPRADPPSVVASRIRAKTQADATTKLQAAAERMEARGYALTSQTWEAGHRSPAGMGFIAFGALFIPLAVYLWHIDPMFALYQLPFAIGLMWIGVRTRTKGTMHATFIRRRHSAEAVPGDEILSQ